MIEKLFGLWKSDPNDAQTIREYGNVLMEFTENNELIYTIKAGDKDQIILMTFEIVNSRLVTDQPTRPQKSFTDFKINGNTLELYFGGVRSVFLKITT